MTKEIRTELLREAMAAIVYKLIEIHFNVGSNFGHNRTIESYN